MRKDGDRTSVGSFLAIVKDIHKTHLHPGLPLSIISTEYGLGIQSRTRQFKKFAAALHGYARLIPASFLNSSQRASATQKALQDCISIIYHSPNVRLVCWGLKALLNHSCTAGFMLQTPFKDDHVPKLNKTYKWELKKRSKNLGKSLLLGEEVFLFYRNCETEDDFFCQSCQKAEGKRI